MAIYVGEEASWRRTRERLQVLSDRWPAMREPLLCYANAVNQYSDDDFGRLSALLGWLEANPSSSLYPRQLPIPGVNSKWLEEHSPIIRDLVRTLIPQREFGNDLFAVCGLRKLPERIRLRILDPRLRAMFNGLTDVTANCQELVNIQLPARVVFMVENLQTGLSFGDLPGSVVIMAKGYAIQVVTDFPWVMQASCQYWGDLDTHGFAILSSLRSRLPHVQSFLMDEETLHRHRALCGDEPAQHAADSLPSLSPAEQAVYQALKQQRWGQNIRLEQERIDWNYAWQRCTAVAENSEPLT